MGLQSVAQKVTRTLASVGVGLSAGLAIRGVLQTGASFEKVMSEVAARTKATTEEFKSLTSLAEDLGRSTIFDNDAAGRAMVELSKAGFSVTEIMSSVTEVLGLAASDNLDLAEAAAITAGAIKKFELNAADAGRVVDVLAKGAGSALTDVSSFGEQLAYAAGPAREAGYSIESTVAALAALSDKVDKSMAGTGLRQVISGLAKPAAEAQQTLDKLGITVTDAAGNFRPLADIVDDFNAALGGMASGDRLRTLSTLFQRQTANAFAGLMSAGGDALRRLTGELERSQGEAARLAAQMTDNVSGAFTSMMSAIKGAATDFFQTFAEPLKNGLKGVAEFITGPFRAAFNYFANTIDLTPVVGAIAGIVAAGAGLASVSRAFKAMQVAAIPLIAIGRQIGRTYVAASRSISIAFAGVRQIGSGLQVAFSAAASAAQSTLPVFSVVNKGVAATAASVVQFARGSVSAVVSSGLLQLPATLSAVFGSAFQRIRLQSTLVASAWYSVSGSIAVSSAAVVNVAAQSYAAVAAIAVSSAAASAGVWDIASVRIRGAFSLLSANAQIVAGAIVKPFAYAAGAVVAAWEVASAKVAAGFAKVASTSAYQSIAKATGVIRREVGMAVGVVSPYVVTAFSKAFGGVSASASVMSASVRKSFAGMRAATIAASGPIGTAFAAMFAGIRITAGGAATAVRGIGMAAAQVAAGVFGLATIVAAPLVLIGGAIAGVMLASEKGVSALKAGWASVSANFEHIAIQIQKTFTAAFDLVVRIGVKALNALGIQFDTSGSDILDSFNEKMQGLGDWIEDALVDVQFFFENFETYFDLGLAYVDKWAAQMHGVVQSLMNVDLLSVFMESLSWQYDLLHNFFTVQVPSFVDYMVAWIGQKLSEVGNMIAQWATSIPGFEMIFGVDAETALKELQSMSAGGALPEIAGKTNPAMSMDATDVAVKAAQDRIDEISKGLGGDLEAFRWQQKIDTEFKAAMSSIDDAIKNGIPTAEDMAAASDVPNTAADSASGIPTGVQAMNERQGPGIALRGSQDAFDVINRAIRGSKQDQQHKETIGVLNQIAAKEPVVLEVAEI